MGNNINEPGVEATIVRLAVDGIVLTPALHGAGLTNKVIARCVRNRLLIRLQPGVFMLAGATLTGPTALRAALARGRGAAISHWTAAWLDGYTRSPEPDRVHVSLPSLGHLERTRWCHPHAARDLRPRDLNRRGGLLRTTPARTIRDIAVALPATKRSDRDITRLIEEALQLRKTSLERLERQAARETCPVTRPRLKRLVAAQRGMSKPADLKSLGEEWLRELLIRNGLPLPKFNHDVHGFEGDAVWFDLRLIIEFDGFGFHKTRTKFDSDRKRDRTLLQHHFRTVRITDTDFDDIAELEAEIIRILALPAIPLP